MKVMLKILGLSFIGALICTIITGIVTAIIRRNWDDFCKRIGFIEFSFFVEFIWMTAFLYCSCKPQILLTVIMWMWPAIIVNIIVIIIEHSTYKDLIFCTILLALISGVICLSSIFGPVQNLIYVHDMESVDVTYAVSSEEILAKVELKIDNSEWKEYYSVDSPEMRQINGKNIAVYHIKSTAIGSGKNTTEYIPGYAIQEGNELPKIIAKRIYFDTSYINKKDALRTIRRKYQTVIIGDHKFDIDDNWNPYEVYEYREKTYSSNGKDYGLIILNLMDGTCEKYSAAENKIPSWVDFKTTYPR